MKNNIILYGILAGVVYLLLKNKKKPVEVKDIDVVDEEQVTDVPTKKGDVVLNGVSINKTKYHHTPSFNPRGHKAYMDRYLVTPERQIVSAI